MFDSTIILSRQELLGWASSGELAGTLTSPVVGPFDHQVVLARDRELSRRDIVLANNVADVAAAMATVWGVKVEYSGPPESSTLDLPGEALAYNVLGTLNHVASNSTPESAMVADTDLFHRDLVLLEGLRQVASMVPDAVISGTLPAPMTLTVAWSLAEGASTEASINGILPLNVDAIKQPDKSLADHDNQIARNIAELQQILRNPFLTSTRLVVQSTVDSHEAESYVLIEDTAIRRVWQAEPGLEGRMRVIYDKATQAIGWAPEGNSSPLYHTQPYAVGGTIAGACEILPYLEPRKDVEFWRQKALQVVTKSIREVMASQITEPGPISIGDTYEDRGSAIFVRPGQIVTGLGLASLPLGLARVALLFTPTAEIIVDGAKGIGGTPGSGHYTDYPTSGGTVSWQLKLAPGSWRMAIYYTNMVGEPAPKWPFLVQLGSTIISNMGLKVTQANGVIERADYYVTSLGGNETLSLSWAPPSSVNQLRIERIVFVRDADSQSFGFTARIGELVSGGVLGTAYGPESVVFDSLPYRTDALSFLFELGAAVSNPALELSWVSVNGTIGSAITGAVPIRIEQVEVMSYEFPPKTPNSAGFEGWTGEMADRAADAVIESFRAGVQLDPTFEPTELVSGQRYWTVDSTAKWVELLKTLEPRFDQAFRPGGPGDIGCPALIPVGLEFDLFNEALPRSTTLEAEVIGAGTMTGAMELYPVRVLATVPGTLSYPTLAAYQPWMATLRLPVMREAFWGEPMAMLDLLSLNIFTSPPFSAITTGSGLYPTGSPVTITATSVNPAHFTWVGWYENGSLFSSSPAHSFTLNNSMTLEARFVDLLFTVTTSSNPSNGGTTSGGGDYLDGASVTVVASAGVGYTFVDWTEGATSVSSSASYGFTISGNRTLVANFTLTPPLSPPIIAPTTGSVVVFPLTVTMVHTNPPGPIMYAINGDPKTAGISYTTPITIQEGDTVYAYCPFNGGRAESSVVSASYTKSTDIIQFEYVGVVSSVVGAYDNYWANDWVPTRDDYKWRITCNFATTKTIQRLEIYETDPLGFWNSGQAWATNSPIYPVVTLGPNGWLGHTNPSESFGVFGIGAKNNSSGLEIQFDHYEPFLENHTGSIVLDCWGDIAILGSSYFRLFVIFADNSVAEAFIDF